MKKMDKNTTWIIIFAIVVVLVSGIIYFASGQQYVGKKIFNNAEVENNVGPAYRPIDDRVWELVYNNALSIEWNNTILNLIKKAKKEYQEYVVDLFAKSDIFTFTHHAVGGMASATTPHDTFEVVKASSKAARCCT